MIKKTAKKLYGYFERGIIWLHQEFQESMDRLVKDLRSMRILWIWLLLMLWFWVVIWGMLYHADKLGITIVITLAGMVSVIIPSYLLSKQHEKLLEHEQACIILNKGFEAEVNENEEGASD